MKFRIQLSYLLFFFIFGLSCLKCAYSQGFYFNMGGGYGFNTTATNNIDMCKGFSSTEYPQFYFPAEVPFGFTGSNITYTETSQNIGTGWSNTYNASNNGFGKGFSFYASAGYSFSKYFSAEIGFSYLAGTTLQSTYIYNAYNYSSPNDIGVVNETYSNTLTCSAHCRLIPSVKFSLPISHITSYVKAGLVIGMGGNITLSNSFAENQYYNNNGQIQYPNSGLITTGLTASGGISFGATAALGAEYAINNCLSVYAEVNIISENWSPTQGDITNYTEAENGQNIPFTLSSNAFTYCSSVTLYGSDQTSPNKILVNSEYPKQTFSYGSYGVAIGVKLSIPTKKSTPPSVGATDMPKSN